MKKALALVLASVLALGLGTAALAEETKVSYPGNYAGYSEQITDFTTTQSLYVEVPAYYDDAPRSDPEYTGETIKLAVDVVLPADEDGNVIPGSYPAVIVGSRGGRTEADTRYDVQVGLYCVKHGYAFMMVEMRGCGASFGVNNSFASLENRMDMKYIMEEWLPTQEWYSGKCGMFGGSNRGLIQSATAAVTPKGYAGAVPSVNNADFYFQDYPNGVSSTPGSSRPLSGTTMDAEAKSYEDWVASTTVSFVDEDPDGKMAYDAYVYQTAHNKSFTTYMLLPNMNRDEENEFLYNEKINLTIPPMEYPDALKDGETEFLTVGGYVDSNASHLLALANMTGGYTIMSDGNHGSAQQGGSTGGLEGTLFRIQEEELRWFDYTLKGIDNGYADQPHFYYQIMGEDAENNWHYADNMPLARVDHVEYFFGSQEDGIALGEAYLLDGEQSNNGILTTEAPAEGRSVDYRVDTSVVSPTGFSNLAFTTTDDLSQDYDKKGLTFTSEPLTEDMTLNGIGNVDLYISSENANDADFICFLELVKPDGFTSYLAHGVQRASHRAIAENELWDSTDGLAGHYHPSMTEDVEAALAEGLTEPVHLSFFLDLMGWDIAAGDSLRLNITCCNTGVYQHYMYYDEEGNLLEGEDLPLITLYTGADKPSSITLPVVADQANTLNGTVTFADGSFEGPATLYMLENAYFLQYNGTWMRLEKGTDDAAYTVNEDGQGVFAAFTFQPEGEIILNGAAQNYQGGAEGTYAFPEAE